jgi:hypothetical protein
MTTSFSRSEKQNHDNQDNNDNNDNHHTLPKELWAAFCPEMEYGH